MACQIFVFAFVLIALTGLVSTANGADSKPIAPDGVDSKSITPAIASTVPDVNIIGTIDDKGAPSPNAAVAAPLGSELDAKRFAPTPSDATTVGVSVVQAATAVGAVS
ncbi:hypothetical protein F3Y22_tig00110988pilonHSYRG00433 [Hibiscus syriacus]|uniref:Secreted protein n=1 Tax=Hibiscus syriacus TaxID=106335 RepID=A0A6A2ZB74_HIBSY|nr:anther-specific protein BCP1-like [Hibiscus syriacus]KAE8688345.1 hypothetical protein F3Y22_tig00110988pilonHSYRG00433 [Hibiscus syriacus]